MSTTAVTPIFVIGTGRSGTHLLANILASHPEITATIEKEPMFGLSTSIALNPGLKNSLLPELLDAYRREISITTTRIYCDKSHPNLWHVEVLLEHFPRALFIGIERNPYACIASMMKHSGVSAWHFNWRHFPIPNQFLGITEAIASEYETLCLPEKCALRWLAHHERMNEVQRTIGDKLLLIHYENLVREPKLVLGRLAEFLGLHGPFYPPEIKKETLDKWKIQLIIEEINKIETIISISP